MSAPTVAPAGDDLFLALRELAERRRNADGGHGGVSFSSSVVLSDAVSSKSDSRGPISCGSGSLPTSGSCVFMPLPVTQMTTGPSSLPMCPLSIRRIAAPSVTPPAVSVKIPSVSASRLIAATISSSLGFAAQPPEPMMVLARVEAVGGVADRQRLRDAGRRLHRLHLVALLQHHVDDRRAARRPGRRGCAACARARDQPQLLELAERLADLGDQRSARHRHDDVRGQPPAELLGDLVARSSSSPRRRTGAG